MKKLEDVVKKVLMENINKPSPLEEIYKKGAERTKFINPGAETADTISARYGNIFKNKKST